MKGDTLDKSYFDVLGLCCSSEVALIEKILKPIEGIHHVSVIVTSRTVIVLHDTALVSQLQIVKALNQARLEANVRMKGDESYRNKWPSPLAIGCGVLLLLSFLRYVFPPFKWLALGAVAVGIVPLILKAIGSLRNFRFDINLLMLIAVGGSIFLKDYWEAGTIVFLLNISEWLERRASHKATAVMSSLMNIAPQKAVIADTGEEVEVKEVMVNTRLAVKAGTMIPIDGLVVEGNCEVDEKTLTGESFPVSKQVDSIVYAGTININGYISVKTTALADDCVVARMAKLVEEAQNNKSKTQRYVDRIAKYYTPAVCVVAAGLAGIPAAMQVHNLQKWYHLALVVLVSACPCALILSTPVAAFCALSKAATSGLLVKGAEYLEILSTIKVICFDKTGTITKGEFSVSNFHPLTETDRLLYWVSSIESKSSHPMAAALVDYAKSHSVEPQPDNVEEFKDFPGEGIYGKIDGKDLYIGNKKIAIRAGCSLVPKHGSENNEGKSIGYIFLGSTLAGTFSLTDSCRIGVKEALEELKSMGIRTAMLTGDSQAAANHAQNQLGGALEVVHAELLPQDKASIVRELQKESPTAMVGDGLNDAPALATADIGISMGVSGSALANETGHVILMSNDIRKIPVAVRLARRTRRKIFENIFIAVITKAAIIALAIAGHPLVWAAVLADVGTCIVVILNSMLLLQGASSRSMKKHSSHNHTQCLSASKVQNNCSDVVKKHGTCCGHKDDAQELKHLVQKTKEDSCCAHDDVDPDDSCCINDDHVHEVTHCTQETKDCCAHDVDPDGCCAHEDDGEIHEVKQVIQPPKCLIQETKCCNVAKALESQSCGSAKKQGECKQMIQTPNCLIQETKCCNVVKDLESQSCGSGKKQGECKQVIQTQTQKGIIQETKCCNVAKDLESQSCGSDKKEGECKQMIQRQKGVIQETKCCNVVKDLESQSCGSGKKQGECKQMIQTPKCVIQETKCCKVVKDLESQSCGSGKNQVECSHEQGNNVNMKKHDNHHHDHEHHHVVKEYITKEELGKAVNNCCKSNGLKKRHVSGCCKSLVSYKCCAPQYFGRGFGRKGYLSEIVIE